jgi:TatD DNase family protein
VTNSGLRLIDTHAHLDDDQFAGDIDSVIGRAVEAGVERIVNIGYRPERWRTTLALAARFPTVAFTLGLHPHHTDEWSPDLQRTLRALLASERPLAVGEIGLDYYRNLSPANIQIEAFSRQLELASEFRLPVVIHQRGAEQDLMRVLEDAPNGLACVLHSFDGTVELAAFAMERGYFLGVGGLMTRASGEGVRDVLRTSPLDRLLLETDSPYLVPVGVKNRRNEPANIAIVLQRLAELRGVEVKELAAITTTNAEQFFGTMLSATTCGRAEAAT